MNPQSRLLNFFPSVYFVSIIVIAGICQNIFYDHLYESYLPKKFDLNYFSISACICHFMSTANSIWKLITPFDANICLGALAWYGKLTWESANASISKILCYLIVWGMTLIFMARLSFYAIPLLIYDVMNDITIIP